MKKIVLTGGGTAGHVMPCVALMPKLKADGYKAYYIGSKNGIERTIIEKTKIPYYGISSGKLRRYFDMRNFTDAFRVIKGIGDANSVLKKIKPDIVFSKGGFVTVPVVIAAKFLKIPVIIHESDLSCGLANKIAIPFADLICVSFPETLEHLNGKNAVLTGTPIRKKLFSGEKGRGLEICGFNTQKPVVLVIGGSLGSKRINEVVREALPIMLKSFQVAHICGAGNKDEGLNGLKGYYQFEYVDEDMNNLYAAADVAVSRAGANVISELLALNIPALLIPLSKNASRGDQILNADSFAKQGFAKVLYEEDLTEATLVTEIIDTNINSNDYKEKMKAAQTSDGITEIMSQIQKYCSCQSKNI